MTYWLGPGMTWWGRGGVWHPPPELTAADRDWLGGHLRLAGLRDDMPPPNTTAAFMMNSEALFRALRGYRDE